MKRTLLHYFSAVLGAMFGCFIAFQFLNQQFDLRYFALMTLVNPVFVTFFLRRSKRQESLKECLQTGFVALVWTVGLTLIHQVF